VKNDEGRRISKWQRVSTIQCCNLSISEIFNLLQHNSLKNEENSTNTTITWSGKTFRIAIGSKCYIRM